MGVNLLAGQQPQQQGEGAEAPPDAAAAPEASRLISCCPGLQSLHMNSLRLADAQLLTGLLSLQDLSISSTDASALAAVCQTTQLRQLSCWHEGEQDHFGDGLLLQLTQLRQLTRLRYKHWEGAVMPVSLKSQVSPVVASHPSAHAVVLCCAVPQLTSTVSAGWFGCSLMQLQQQRDAISAVNDAGRFGRSRGPQVITVPKRSSTTLASVVLLP